MALLLKKKACTFFFTQIQDRVGAEEIKNNKIKLMGGIGKRNTKQQQHKWELKDIYTKVKYIVTFQQHKNTKLLTRKKNE